MDLGWWTHQKADLEPITELDGKPLSGGLPVPVGSSTETWGFQVG